MRCCRLPDILASREKPALDVLVAAALLSLVSLIVVCSGEHKFDPEGIILAHSFITVFLVSLAFVEWREPECYSDKSHLVYMPHSIVLFLFGFVFGQHRNQYLATLIVSAVAFVLHGAVFVRVLLQHRDRELDNQRVTSSGAVGSPIGGRLP